MRNSNPQAWIIHSRQYNGNTLPAYRQSMVDEKVDDNPNPPKRGIKLPRKVTRKVPTKPPRKL